jgi:hypothetical protein
METRCDGCGSLVGAEQAFCPRCGAVIGMTDAAEQHDGGWDMQTTMVGHKRPSKPAPPPAPAEAPPAAPAPAQATGAARPAAAATTGAARPAAKPAAVPGASRAAEPARSPRGVNTVLLAVIGFVAVLLIGGLLLLLR